MVDLVPTDRIEQIVGVRRHERKHYGRAVSAEQTVYILHSHQCLEGGRDLRDCPYSVALGYGIDLDRWVQDVPVPLVVEDGELLPAPVGPHAVHVVECGVTRTVNGREWICIAEPHDSEHQKSRRRDRNGYPARSERHYMVPRYPMRGES